MENHEVTELLARWGGGDKDVLERLLPMVYAELHRMAAAYLRRERIDHTLQPTALINEAYLRAGRQQQRKLGEPCPFLRHLGTSDAPHSCGPRTSAPGGQAWGFD